MQNWARPPLQCSLLKTPALNQIRSTLLHLAQSPKCWTYLTCGWSERSHFWTKPPLLVIASTDPFTPSNQPNLTQNHLLSGLCCCMWLLKPFEAICAKFRGWWSPSERRLLSVSLHYSWQYEGWSTYVVQIKKSQQLMDGLTSNSRSPEDTVYSLLLTYSFSNEMTFPEHSSNVIIYVWLMDMVNDFTCHTSTGYHCHCEHVGMAMLTFSSGHCCA